MLIEALCSAPPNLPAIIIVTPSYSCHRCAASYHRAGRQPQSVGGRWSHAGLPRHGQTRSHHPVVQQRYVVLNQPPSTPAVSGVSLVVYRNGNKLWLIGITHYVCFHPVAIQESLKQEWIVSSPPVSFWLRCSLPGTLPSLPLLLSPPSFQNTTHPQPNKKKKQNKKKTKK